MIREDESDCANTNTRSLVGGVSDKKMQYQSSEEDENHSCQDEELVINTLMTEPELVDMPEEEDMALRVKR